MKGSYLKTAEHKLKLSLALKGRKAPWVVKWHRGKNVSKETREKISKALIGRPRSLEARHSISMGKKGKPAWNKGIKQNKEWINNSRKARIGLKHSPETRLKMSKSKEGNKCYLWQGGITEKNKKIRTNIEYRLWREAVFARDNWTCQHCGVRGIYLNAHHIKYFSEYQELRFDIHNGITLCKNCHKQVHLTNKVDCTTME